jgi:hypothetical protein
MASDHRPKNNHNRMIIGIGTPNSHNKIPRPIVSSSILVREGNAERKGLFRYYLGISDIESAILTSEWALRG